MFLSTYDGLVHIDQVTLIEPQDEHNGLPYHVVHYRYLGEMRLTRAHPDYVQQIPQTVATLCE